MKKVTTLLLAIGIAASTAYSQSKVFNEVNSGISTQVSAISQNSAVIGYLAFTRLEKITDEEFNYRISLMDENLNDIGTINFKEKDLMLQHVAFEQDVICLSYVKPDWGKRVVRKKKQKDEPAPDRKNSLLLQFVSLDGKIIGTDSIPVTVVVERASELKQTGPAAKFKSKPQLMSVPNHGFVSVFGDKKGVELSFYSSQGKQIWKKKVEEDIAGDISILTSDSSVYLLTNGKENKNIRRSDVPNSFEILGYNVKEGSAYAKRVIKDKKGHQLELLAFGTDPATGKPFMSGVLKGTRGSASNYSPNSLMRGEYAGLFTYDITGTQKQDMKETFTYWDDNSNAQITQKGFNIEHNSYPLIQNSFRDFEGNTYFAADGIRRKVRPGRIIGSLFIVPLSVFNPVILLTVGTRSAKLGDPLIYKLGANGQLTTSTIFEGEKSKWYPARSPLYYTGSKSYLPVANSDLKQQYLVVNETNKSSIYNVATKKVVRSIPTSDKNIVRGVTRAKDGHILITEYNKKEKYTRISIEAL
ncbi:hypothetical protein HHL16_22795 [Pseudoflavitalea sp. G-6-1-2]|uniref:DUF6770 family protein n=1 Tax=Pseudoflavitalea sp. G-6-1-2 TaxID=2728841 RepID=UPI00146BB1EB|nr:DUF6770 family protein [Pseudoflavitalea sp. G-6-1-2]NML23727.1 hypothetical protein [Pseudoflavitalea sp. G-6-1-2]